MSSNIKKKGFPPPLSHPNLHEVEEEDTDPGIILESIDEPELEQSTKEPLPDLGVLNAFLKDIHVTEIMVNDFRNVAIEKEGKLQTTAIRIHDQNELNRIVQNILSQTGRVLTQDSPYIDTVLSDGSRVNIITKPLTQNGPCITIRKFPQRPKVEQLIQNATLTKKTALFLQACVLGKMNILISGGTGSGKTTLLNILTQYIPKTERIITVEETPEIVLTQPNSVCLMTKPLTPGSQMITERELVTNALRMRPDRIIVGECRRSEALDMLQAMNTGHDGSMTTVHANTTRDALARIETLCLMAGVNQLSQIALRKQITSALDLIIQIRRMRNGKRKIVEISEITGMEGDTITLQEVFKYDQPLDQIVSTGLVPTFLDRLTEQGIKLADDFFA